MSIYDKASLVLIPSGTKTSKVYSQKPVNGDGDFTFSRSTAATRVNADGNIEKETQNLFTYSNTFSDTDWTKTSVSVTGGQSGYDGSSDASLIEVLTSGAPRKIAHNQTTASGVLTMSVYAKAGTAPIIAVEAAGSNGFYKYFNLSTGTEGSQGGSIIDSSMVDVGSGWYRLSITGNATSVSSPQYFVCDVDNFTTATAGANIYIQDAQLEQGLVARDYIETTTAAVEGGITDNVPRLDYTDSSCPALLLEPQRTNLVTNSEYITSPSNGTIDHNNTTSPEGLTNAILFTSDNSAASYFRSNVFAATDPTNISVFLKYTNNQYIQLLMSGDVEHYVNFDIQNGSIATSGAKTSNETIKNYGNGWYRISATFTGYTGNPTARIYLSNSSSAGYGGASSAIGQSVYVYGLQAESGSYATSYIPTYGTSVTRNQDNPSSTNIIDADNDFTFYFECDKTPDDAGQYVDFSGNLGYLSSYNNSRIRWRYESSNLQSPVSEGTFKFLIRKDSTDIKMYVNGELKHTKAVPSGLQPFDLKQGAIHKILLFPTALTDEECIDLTTI